MSIGQTLRNAREQMGLTDLDVAEHTHMMIQMVREIENDDFHRFAAPVYGKGFLKLYAKVVGLDPAPLIEEYLNALGKNGRLNPLKVVDAPKNGIHSTPPTWDTTPAAKPTPAVSVPVEPAAAPVPAPATPEPDTKSVVETPLGASPTTLATPDAGMPTQETEDLPIEEPLQADVETNVPTDLTSPTAAIEELHVNTVKTAPEAPITGSSPSSETPPALAEANSDQSADEATTDELDDSIIKQDLSTAKPLKANTVTLPNTDAPFKAPNWQSVPRQHIPPNPAVAASAVAEPVTPATPVAERVVEKMDPPAGGNFKLQTERVNSVVPPKPIESDQTPFSFPSPARKQQPLPEDATSQSDKQSKHTAQSRERPTNRIHGRGMQQRGYASSDAYAEFVEAVKSKFSTLASKLVELFRRDTDEEYESRFPKRYLYGGIGACVVIVAILAISISGPSKSDADTEISEVSQVVEHTTPLANTEAPSTGVSVPMPPAELVRIAPPPRMFAQ